MRSRYISWVLVFILILSSIVTNGYAATWGSSENLNEIFRTSEKKNLFDISEPHKLDDFRNIKQLRPLLASPTELIGSLRAFGCEEIGPQSLEELWMSPSCVFTTQNLVSLHNDLWKVYVQGGRPVEDYCRSLLTFRNSLRDTYIKHLEAVKFAYRERNNDFEDDREWIATSDADETAETIIAKNPSIPLFEATYLTTFFKAYAAMAILTDHTDSSCKSELIFNKYTSVSPDELQAVVSNAIAAGVRDIIIRDKFIELGLSHVTINRLSISSSVILALNLRKSNIGLLKIENSIVTPSYENELFDQNGVQYDERSMTLVENEIEKISISQTAFLTLNQTGFLASGEFGEFDLFSLEYNTPQAFDLAAELIKSEFSGELKDIINWLSREDFSDYKRNRRIQDFTIFDAQVKNSLTIKDSAFGGNLYLGKIKADELRFIGLFVEGDMNLWGAEVSGPSFFGKKEDGRTNTGLTILGDLLAWYAKLDDVQIEGIYVRGAAVFNFANIGGQFYMGQSSVAKLYANGLRASIFHVESSSIENLVAKNAMVDSSFTVRQSKVNFMNLDDSSFQNLVFIASGAISSRYVTNTKDFCPPDVLAVDTMNGDRFGLSHEHQKLLTTNSAGGILTNCSGKIWARGIVVRNAVYLSGYFSKSVNFSGANFGGSVSLGDRWTQFGPSACVNLRGVIADAVVFDPQNDLITESGSKASGQNNTRASPIFVDIFGAKFRAIQPSAPIPDRINRDAAAAAALQMLVGKPDMACVEDGYKKGANVEFSSYRPEIFDALAVGYEATGNIDLARQIRIEKNRAYAAALPKNADWHRNFPSKFIYWLADSINGFGYKNINALLWLAFFIVMGAIFSVIGEMRLQRAIDFCFGKFGAKPRRWPRGSGRTVKSPGSTSPFAFSLDRAIPSLGLDSAFGTHNRNDLGPILSAWFYFQRTACYVIIALMIAGTFNVFQ